MKGKFYIIIFASVFSLLVFFSCKEEIQRYPVVEVENVGRKNIEIYGDYVGLIKPAASVEIHARVEGFLEDVTFENGRRITAGEPLFYINNATYRARVERVKAQLVGDEAQLVKAIRDLERIRPLYELNAASRLDLDNAEAAVNIAKANISMSKADLAEAELQLSYTIVSSPLTGYINALYSDIGTLVGGAGSSLLATVVKRDTVQVSFKLTSLDYLRSQQRNIHIGETDSTRAWQPTVTVTLADNTEYRQQGVVDFASPIVDSQTGTFEVTAKLPNRREILLPGQFTRVRLLLDVVENAVVIPRKALIVERGGVFVYVVRPDSVAEKRFLEIGNEQSNEVEVVRGLVQNERIVTEGYQKLANGQKVIALTHEEVVRSMEEEKTREDKR